MPTRTWLASVAFCALTAPLPVLAADPAPATDPAGSDFEKRLADLEQANRDLTSRLNLQQEMQSRLHINGFFSAGLAMLDDEDYVFDARTVDMHTSYNSDAIAGLQFDMKINDRMNAMTQLVARGESGFSVAAEWAYLAYRPTANDEIRAGRLRIPFFMFSEYLEVGYTYPWARPPIESYRRETPSSYEGISWDHTFNAGSWTHEFQFDVGVFSHPLAGGNLSVRNISGVTWFGTRDNLTLRLGYQNGDTVFTIPTALTPLTNPALPTAPILANNKGHGQFGGAGLQYDNGKLLAIAEISTVSLKGLWADTDRGYVTLGWHFGKWLPFVTAATVETTDKWVRHSPAVPGTLPANALNRALDQDQDSYSLGVRYDFLPKADLKIELTQVHDTDKTFGAFVPARGASVMTTAFPDDNIHILRVVVDATF